jgi:hypothetical protein
MYSMMLSLRLKCTYFYAVSLFDIRSSLAINLLVTEGFDRVEPGGGHSRVHPEEYAHQHG